MRIGITGCAIWTYCLENSRFASSPVDEVYHEEVCRWRERSERMKGNGGNLYVTKGASSSNNYISKCKLMLYFHTTI